MALRLRSGYVPDHARIHPWLTVGEALGLARALHPRWDAARASALVSRSELPLNRKVKQLSRGERAKLAFTLAAAPGPELLVLDEPTWAWTRWSATSSSRSSASSPSCPASTILFSTHIMADVDGVAERAVLMQAGAVVADAPVAALKDRFRKASLFFAEPPARAPLVAGARRVSAGLRDVAARTHPDESGTPSRLGLQLGPGAHVLRPGSP